MHGGDGLGEEIVQLQRLDQIGVPDQALVGDVDILELLVDGVDKIDRIAARMQDVGVKDRSLIWNTDLVETLELDNLIAQAQVTMRSATNRKESRGVGRVRWRDPPAALGRATAISSR